MKRLDECMRRNRGRWRLGRWGAGVSNSARMSEKKVLCGAGKVMRLDVTTEVSLSQASQWKRLFPERREPFLEAGKDDGG